MIPAVTQPEKGREWIYPKLIKGKLYAYRNYVSYVLLALLFAGPFIKVNGEQLVLLNLLERKFAFFGVVFYPQDFYIFVLAMLSFLVFVILFTVIFGRVWCGWACPQTIFMEMVFRKIEFWIEGNAQDQKRLDSSPWTGTKILKKGFKHFLFITISFAIANTFLSYIIGSENLFKIITDPVEKHIGGFASIIIFTGIFYGVFAYVREVVCTVICPYGRLQGVLLDRKSLIVAYDYGRGEPRGKITKEVENSHGDCIDCGLCVQVCPTGIDIRKGTQLECINCTACIDACDFVMEKIGREKDLIGFKSEAQIHDGIPFKFGKRVYGYAAVLMVLVSILAILLVRRTDIDTTILRASGTLYQQRPDGTVSNLYNAELVNKTSETIEFQIKSTNKNAVIEYINPQHTIKKGESLKITFFLILPQKQITKYKSEIAFKVIALGKTAGTAQSAFIAPPNF